MDRTSSRSTRKTEQAGGKTSGRTPKARCPLNNGGESEYSYDSAVGILHWKNNYNGAAISIDIRRVKEGHCSEIMSRNYKDAPNDETALRDLAAELDANYHLDEVARTFGIAHLL